MTDAASLVRRLRPASLALRAAEPLLRAVRVDEHWDREIHAAAGRGAIVFVLRSASLADLVALAHLGRRAGLPPLGFANELGGWLEPTRSHDGRAAGPSARLREAIAAGESAALFLRRAPTVLERAGATHRGATEGDELLRELLALARRDEREIVLLPVTFVWTQRPEQRGFSLVDTLFGPSEYPGELRALAQFALNLKNCVVRTGEALGVREFLDLEAETSPEADDHALARRLTYALLRRLERERRAVLGPVHKPNDRVREEVLRSPKLQAILREMAGPGERERALLTAKARGMLRELTADPDPATVKGMAAAADRLVDVVYNGLDVDVEGLERVRAAARSGSIVLLPSHKSHVDYLLLSYVLRKHALMLPMIAAGDNLSFFPLGPMFRRAGAFFIRRKFKGDRLYTAVVDAYVRRLLKDGHAIEFFLEGGRSRTGKLLPPMLGLLNMVVDAALTIGGRRVFFVPVSIGYERMVEEGTYARELSGGAKPKETAAALLKVGGVLREKYGRANVQFGRIVELADIRRQLGVGADYTPAKRRAIVSRLAHTVMSEINRATAVTPGSLVAVALLCHGRRGLAHADLVALSARLLHLVQRLGARTTPSLTRGPGGDLREAAIREAAVLYVRGGLVVQHVPGDTLTDKARVRARIYTGDDVIYTVPDDKRLSLDMAKNIIVHLFVDRALVSVALLGTHGPAASLADLRERVRSLSRLFKLEFMFRADATFEAIFEDTVASMAKDGELVRDGDRVSLGPGREGMDGRAWVAFYASVVRNFIESYRVAARALRVLVRGPLPQKDLAARALRIGERMFLGGEIERSEAVSRPVLENAFAAFLDEGYLQRTDGKLALTESFLSEEAAQAIEGRIAAHLLRRAGDLG
jgi:glycerol-3-phosphate O-acyltransferase